MRHCGCLGGQRSRVRSGEGRGGGGVKGSSSLTIVGAAFGSEFCDISLLIFFFFTLC